MIKNTGTSLVIELIERGWMSDVLTRRGIRHLCQRRLDEVSSTWDHNSLEKFADLSSQMPIAPRSEKANEQHYEVPAAFFDLVLGPRRKYSCCSYEKATTLAEAEVESLEMTCQRAELRDGQDVLELGCGWGSLTLWMAEQYPNSRITAVSNSNSQREFIMAQAKERRVADNLTVITADMNDFQINKSFDRVVSVEMFEHMRNHRELLSRVANWLRPDGKLFVHIFCHKSVAYPFETEGSANWMGRYFFTGGIMPSQSLFHQYNEDLKISSEWTWNGTYYEKTSNHWLENLDRNRKEIRRLFEVVYGSEANRWINRWRVFFMACAELFGMNGGNEWFVGHYLFEHSTAKKETSQRELAGV